MLGYVKLTRPNVSILGALAVVLGALVAGGADPYFILLGTLAVFLISSGGNALNDYFDYDIDRINKPGKPIVSGEVGREQAGAFAGILLVLGNLIAVVYLNLYMSVFAVLNTALILLYNWKIKRTPYGHFLDSWFAASSFVFGGLLGVLNLPLGILFFMSYLGNLGREIAKGIEDIRGDRHAGAHTFAVIFGKKISINVAAASVVLAVLISPVPFLLGYFGLYYLILVVLADAIYVFSVFDIAKDAKKAQGLMKAGMFLGMAAFLTGALL